jgi:hypothetical protein
VVQGEHRQKASITETNTTGCSTCVAYEPRPALAISESWVGQRRRTQARHHNEGPGFDA